VCKHWTAIEPQLLWVTYGLRTSEKIHQYEEGATHQSQIWYYDSYTYVTYKPTQGKSCGVQDIIRAECILGGN
jgi:hypothetical protein